MTTQCHKDGQLAIRKKSFKTVSLNRKSKTRPQSFSETTYSGENMKTLFVLAILCVFGCCSAAKKSYRGYQVFQAFANDVQDLKFLDIEAEANRVNIVGSGPTDLTKASTTFYVAPELVDEIKQDLHTRRIAFRITSTDLQSDIDLEQSENENARLGGEWFLAYHTFDEILVWLEEQVTLCGPQCSLFDIGNSYEGRPLRVIKLTGAPNACVQKPAIWIDATIHAREWISTTTNMYLLNGLITEYATDPVIQNFRDTYDWYFLTVVNPDGYDYTWTDDRLWRKSRQPNEGSACVGADVNRNFDFQWMTVGASDSPCSETYAGSAPNSEPEAKAVSDYLLGTLGSWDLFWTLHTYGQLYMSPYGYTIDLPDNYPAMARVGEAGVQAIYDTHGVQYTFGPASIVLYLSSGTSRDFAAGAAFIPFVYTLELRNLNSFVLPPSEILPTGEEIWAGLIATDQQVQVEKPPTCVSV